MIKKNHRVIVLIIMVLSSILVFTACAARNTDPNQQNNMGQQNGTQTPNVTGGQNGLQQPDMTGQDQNLLGGTQLGTNPGVNQMGTSDGTKKGITNEINNGTNNGTNTGMNNGMNTGMNNGTNNATKNGTNTMQTRTQQTQQNSLADYSKRADIIRDKLETMTEVDNASVVVMGNTALVGYKPANNSKNSEATKNAIIKKVKETDKAIQNVTVTDALDLTTQVNRIADDIRNNKPIDQINASIDKIMKEINPNTG